MAAPGTRFVRARQVFTEHGGMLRASKAIRLGIHPRTLYALRDAGEIEQVGHGTSRTLTCASERLARANRVADLMRPPV